MHSTVLRISLTVFHSFINQRHGFTEWAAVEFSVARERLNHLPKVAEIESRGERWQSQPYWASTLPIPHSPPPPCIPIPAGPSQDLHASQSVLTGPALAAFPPLDRWGHDKPFVDRWPGFPG